MKAEDFLSFSPEAKRALDEGRPVVALESTIISHGLPYPENERLALELEQIVRDEGAVPATIALMNGKIKTGLSAEEISVLAKGGRTVHKVSRRDLAWVLSKKLTGATTVSATMLAAHWAGIKFFATGGIGGVHRGAAESFDISADLEELAQTKVCVVSSGVKSILDIGATLEYLETKGVPVVAFGQKKFPAFYVAESDFDAPFAVNDLEELRDLIRMHFALPVKSGILVANPVPRAYGLEADDVNAVIEEALAEQRRLGVSGKEITPFLLARLVEKTKGETLKANLALVKENARLVARVGVGM